jgi:hypothetical protein
MWQNMSMAVGDQTVSEFTSNPMWRPGEPSLLSPYKRRTGYSDLGRNDPIIAHNILQKPNWGLPETWAITQDQPAGAYGLGGSQEMPAESWATSSGNYNPATGIRSFGLGAMPSPAGILEKILGSNPSPFKSVAFGFVVALLICSRRS